MLRNGEGGIRTLDGGIHPHNALAGRRLQPLGHFSARCAQDSRASFGGRTDGQSPHVLLGGAAFSHSATYPQVRAGSPTPSDPPTGGGKGGLQDENELAGSPLIPRQSETRLRLPEAGFAFQSDYSSVPRFQAAVRRRSWSRLSGTSDTPLPLFKKGAISNGGDQRNGPRLTPRGSRRRIGPRLAAGGGVDKLGLDAGVHLSPDAEICVEL